LGTCSFELHRKVVHNRLEEDCIITKSLTGLPRKLVSCSGIRVLSVLLVATAFPILALPQQPDTETSNNSGAIKGTPALPGELASQKQESKRIFGIIPNYRTSPSLHPYSPITPGEKFKIASEDSFDRGTFVLAAAFAGEAQLTNNNRAFGQGLAGYGRYLGTSYADFVIGDFMTEAIYPTLLHQDPRYFRRGSGGTWARLGYAIGQTFWTHNDSGSMQFNYSEILGNATAVAISNAYYVDNRDVSDAVIKLGNQIGVDLAANILKEFWPDLERKFSRKHKLAGP
jgi:hypothetical protein